MNMHSAAMRAVWDRDLICLATESFALSESILRGRDDMARDEIESLASQSDRLSLSGTLARQRGQEDAAAGCFREAFGLALRAANRMADGVPHPGRLELLRKAVQLALECGEAAEARRLIRDTLDNDPSVGFAEEWAQFLDESAWSDVWLLAAVRLDPPDAKALDTLAERYWKPLFARCQMLTLNRETASDLAQQAWCRVLRARRTLKPGGNFPGFLATIATNLWRDSQRSARRAGPLADDRLASLDAAFAADEGESATLGETLPDLSTLRAEEQKVLALDIDQALGRLTPLMRDMLVSRLIVGESCAEIGIRYNRTEQTISAWVRQAIREMKRPLEEWDRGLTAESKQ
jgi:RNA polymerase sigma-70 factor, ECF subfamily